MKLKLTIYISILLLGLTLASSASAAITLRPPLNLGLVGYWSMNEGTGTKAGDASGNGNTGTLGAGSSAPTWTDGKRGKALSFNGTSSYVDVGQTMAISTGDSTISAWIKTTDTTYGGVIYARRASTLPWCGRTFMYGLEGHLWDYMGNGAGWIENTNQDVLVNDGNWHHVAVTYHAGTITFYVDGIGHQYSKTANSCSIDTNGQIGRRAIPDAYFTGQIDEVRIYNRALSGTEVASLYQSGAAKFLAPNNTGLVGYWSMDEGTGTKAGDSSGNSNTGTISSAASHVQGNQTSNYSGGLSSSNVTLNGVTAGNLIVVWVSWEDADGAPTVSDGTSSLTAGTKKNRTGKYGQFFYLLSANSGNKTYTASFSPSVNYVVMTVMEFSGGTFVFDQQNTGGGSSLSANSGNITTTGSSEIVIGGETNYNGRTVSGLQIGGVSATEPAYSQSASPTNDAVWYSILSSTMSNGAATGTLSGSGTPDWVSNIVSFKISTGSATWTDGKRGKALSFNGTSEYVSAGNVGSGIKTISFWMKADNVVSKKIMNVDGTDQIEINGSSQITATSFPGTTTIYVDGAVASTVDTNWHFITITDTTGVNFSTMELGRVGASYFDGKLDEVRFYNRVLSGTEVTALYNSSGKGAVINSSQTTRATTGLVGMWSFDGQDIYGGTAYDRAGSNNGTITGAVPAIGKVGQALNFNGTSAYVSTADINEIDGVQQYTLSAWVKPTSLAALRRVVCKTTATGFVACMSTFNGADVIIGHNTDGSSYAYTSNILTAGKWDLWTNVFDGTKGTDALRHKFYLNGVEQSLTFSGSMPTTTPTGTNPLSIGANSNASEYFNGQIDEVRIYNRALSVGEVQQLYNMGK